MSLETEYKVIAHLLIAGGFQFSSDIDVGMSQFADTYTDTRHKFKFK